jgi:hypothetical protein
MEREPVGVRVAMSIWVDLLGGDTNKCAAMGAGLAEEIASTHLHPSVATLFGTPK